MVLMYTETGNVLETIRRFQKQFLKRNVYYCRRTCSNLNHTGHYYYIIIIHYYYTLLSWSLLFVCMVSSDSETAFETFWLFPEHYRFLYFKYPSIYWEMWSRMCTNHQSCSSSAFCSILQFQFLVSLSLSTGTVTEYLIM